MSAILQHWGPSNGKHGVPLVFSLMSSKWAKFHPVNRSIVYNSQARRQDFAAGGGVQKSQGGHIFKMQYWMYAATARKSRLRHVNLFIFNSTQKVIHTVYERWTGRAQSFALLQLGQGKRQEMAYFANRQNFYLLVDCSRVSPLSPASSFISHKLQHIRRFVIQQK